MGIAEGCKGAMGIAGRLRRVETGSHPRFSSQFLDLEAGILSERRFRFEFSAFFEKAPRSNGSACESPGPDVAGRRETALEPHRLRPPGRRSGGLKALVDSSGSILPKDILLAVTRSEPALQVPAPVAQTSVGND